MLARLQKIITLCLVLTALIWLLCFAASSPVLAISGFLLLTLGYTLFLAFEFVWLKTGGQADAGSAPAWSELGRAWWGEVRVAPKVFCWRQPFFSNAVPDKLGPADRVYGRRGVVFVHGYFCNRGFWTPWLERLIPQERAFMALNLEPPFGSIDNYSAQIDAAVEQIRQITGLAPLLVCHSMGGLAVRAWLKRRLGQAEVQHIVTIGSPHRGTWLALFGNARNVRQMRLQSDWLEQLSQGLAAELNSLFTCWYSNSDNIVIPASSATLPGADNRLLRCAAHVQMAFLPQVMDATLAMLDIDDKRLV